jgi:hypothetical protein
MQKKKKKKKKEKRKEKKRGISLERIRSTMAQ